MAGPNDERAEGVLHKLNLTALMLWLGLYLDDLLMVAAGICFTAAAAVAFGLAAALAVAGACLLGYGIVIAKARGGGDSR